MAARRGKLAVLFAFAAVSLAVLAFLFWLAGGRIRLGGEPYTARAIVPDAQRLAAHSDVRDQGVVVGRVTDVGNRGAAGVVSFELEDGHAPLHRDATVQVRTKTLVGENYLEIERGEPGTGELEPGATLPVEQADVAVRLDQILSGFDRPTRRNVQRNLQAVGAGLAGRGDELNSFFGAARPAMVEGGKVLRVLDAEREQLAALFDNSASVMDAFAERGADLRTLIERAKRTAEVVADRDRELAETLAELPATLEQVEVSATKFGGFASRATPVARDLRLAAADLGPLISDLRPTARDARRLFARLPAALRVTDPMLVELTGFAEKVPGLSCALAEDLRQLNPALAYLSRYDRDLAVMFNNFSTGWGAITPRGLGRAVMSVSEGSASNLWTPQMRATYDALVGAGVIRELHNLRANHFPKPNAMGSEQPFDGSYPRIKALPPIAGIASLCG